MIKKLIAWVFAGVLGLAYTASAFAYFHTWRINEIYSNADGSVQFLELICLSANGCNNGETLAKTFNVTITVTPAGGSPGTPFAFPNDISPAPLNKSLLLATPGFAAIAGVTPDFTIPAGFLAINGGTINFGGFDVLAHGALPANGILSISRTGVQATNTPTNYAGVAGAVPALALTVGKAGTGSGTVTSSPAGINCGATCSANFGKSNPITLTATPDAGSALTSWSGACTGSGGCTVTMDAAKSVTANFGDSQAPTVPAGLSATAVSGAQINLAWSAATDAVGVTAYPVFRGGVFLTTVNAPATSFGDTGLAPATLYSYTVAACDAAGNCSAPSGPASATTLASGDFLPLLASGFNLMGNSLNTTLDVMAIFGNQDTPVVSITDNIITVWKWNAANGRWQFHSPQLTTAGNAAYVAAHNYEALSSIGPGTGYWVNAFSPMSLPVQNGTNFNWNSITFSALITGFNLITHATQATPSQFNNNVNQTPPSPGVIPTGNFNSLWAWDAAARTWYFYSPSLESSGGLPAVKAYCDSHFYRHFQDYGKTLGIGVGFWVDKLN